MPGWHHHHRLAEQRGVAVGRDHGAGLRHRPARHDRQAGQLRQARSTDRQLRAAGPRAAGTRGRAAVLVRRRRTRFAGARIRSFFPAQDRARNRPGQGTGNVRALAPSGARRARAGVVHGDAGRERAHRLPRLEHDRTIGGCTLHDQGIPISFSINVDPGTIAHPQFMAQINACLERHRILADYITFEITESAVLTTEPHFLERLLRLRMQGFGLAIDDYGTGRSNLQLLARIPFSELKIDRSFVDGASKKAAIGTVLRSCLGLARSLERRSVAVGVETKQDWDFLQGLGCTYAQGYYIAKPMPVEEFPDWLKDWRQFF